MQPVDIRVYAEIAMVVLQVVSEVDLTFQTVSACDNCAS